MSLSRHHGTVIEDNPQSLIYVRIFMWKLSLELKYTSHILLPGDSVRGCSSVESK